MRSEFGSGRGAGARRGRAKSRRGETRAEGLEPRTLLAFAPLGPEFRPFGLGSHSPSVAADADGDFVVVSANGAAIFGQRYSATGAALGGLFSVGTSTGPGSVAMDADGDF